MTHRPTIEHAAGARAVADAPVQALVERADELAGRWAIALVAARPLDAMAEVPLEDIAREAPALCALLAQALASDDARARLLALTPVRARAGANAQQTPGALLARAAAARGAASAVADMEALRGVIWRAVLGELDEPATRLVGDLSDRLAFVCAELLGAALHRHELAGGAVSPPASPAAPSPAQVLYSSTPASRGRATAVLIDEHDDASAPNAGRSRQSAVTGGPSRTSDAARRAGGEEEATQRAHERQAPRARPWDTPLQRQAGAPAGADHSSRALAPDVADGEMTITRGQRSSLDRRT